MQERAHLTRQQPRRAPLDRIDGLLALLTGALSRCWFVDPAKGMPGRLAEYVRKLPREFSRLTLALAGLGVLLLLWRDRRLAALLLAGLLVQL